MAYERPDRAAEPSATPLDAVCHLQSFCAEWCSRCGQSHMPAPLPRGTEEAARFWLQVMYPPPPPPALGRADQPGTDTHVVEARSALRGFLGLAEVQRFAVVRLVQETGIRYRGEPFGQYIQICDEAETLRADPEAYRARVRAAAHRLPLRTPA